jgi:hypothetical protein
MSELPLIVNDGATTMWTNRAHYLVALTVALGCSPATHGFGTTHVKSGASTANPDEETEDNAIAYQQRRSERIARAYEETRAKTGSVEEQLAAWKLFVKAFPGNDNTYLPIAKETISQLETEGAPAEGTTQPPKKKEPINPYGDPKKKGIDNPYVGKPPAMATVEPKAAPPTEARVADAKIFEGVPFAASKILGEDDDQGGNGENAISGDITLFVKDAKIVAQCRWRDETTGQVQTQLSSCSVLSYTKITSDNAPSKVVKCGWCFYVAQGDPSTESGDSILGVTNPQGALVWAKMFVSPGSTYTLNNVVIADINGDGRGELLVEDYYSDTDMEAKTLTVYAGVLDQIKEVFSSLLFGSESGENEISIVYQGNQAMTIRATGIVRKGSKVKRKGYRDFLWNPATSAYEEAKKK